MPVDWVPVQNADSHGDLLLMMMGQKPNCNPSYMEELISNAQGLIERSTFLLTSKAKTRLEILAYDVYGSQFAVLSGHDYFRSAQGA